MLRNLIGLFTISVSLPIVNIKICFSCFTVDYILKVFLFGHTSHTHINDVLDDLLVHNFEIYFVTEYRHIDDSHELIQLCFRDSINLETGRFNSQGHFGEIIITVSTVKVILVTE